MRRRSRTRSSRSRSRTRRRGRCASASSACSAPVARAIWILTFHAACGRILRREAERLGYRSNFTIYDSGRPGPRSSRHAWRSSSATRSASSPRGIHAQISNAKNQLIGPDEYASAGRGFYDQTVADVYGLYQRRLFASNAVDFDDLLMLTVDVLQRFPEARERWAKTFRYILVDEYQDTNHAQYALLQLLAGGHRNVMAVGDPDQCLRGRNAGHDGRRTGQADRARSRRGTRCSRARGAGSSVRPG